MIHCIKKRLRRRPCVLYLITVFILYPLIQVLHLVILPTRDISHIMRSNIELNLTRCYSDSINLAADANTISRKHSSNSRSPSIEYLAGNLQEELMAVHKEIMELLRSRLTVNKTEAHQLNTQVLLLIKKVNNSDNLQSESAKLGVMVEVKDAVYKEMKLIRKLTSASKQGAAALKVKVPQPQRKMKVSKKMPLKLLDEKAWHCLKLKFADPPMPVTALASYPGSGNTWLRHLIQEATGLLTGSLHSDPYLLRSGFPGETTRNGKVVVVKTHSQPHSLKGCSKVVLLLRNPYRSLLADFNRHNRISSNEHTGHAPDNLFREPDWTRRANTLGVDWYMFYEGWLQSKTPLLVLTYEDLKLNPKHHVQRIVQFLGLNIPEKNYECMLNNTEGSYHRKPREREVILFTKEQTDLVKLYADMMNEKLRKYNVTVDTTVPN